MQKTREEGRYVMVSQDVHICHRHPLLLLQHCAQIIVFSLLRSFAQVESSRVSHFFFFKEEMRASAAASADITVGRPIHNCCFFFFFFFLFVHVTVETLMAEREGYDDGDHHPRQ